MPSPLVNVGWRYINATHVGQIIYNGACTADYGVIIHQCVPLSPCNSFTINNYTSSYNVYCSNSPPTNSPVTTIIGSVACGVRDCSGANSSSGLVFYSDNRCTVAPQNPCNSSYPLVPVSWELIGSNIVRQHIYSTGCPGNNFIIDYNCNQCYNITVGTPFSYSFACGGTVAPTNATDSGSPSLSIAYMLVVVLLLSALLY